ncbi:MAG TPA: DNRLRE domain-containing protein [Armatimonadota bacterium]|nr:DNRLRE domain-containing protein [Armatimonadota bacterium]
MRSNSLFLIPLMLLASFASAEFPVIHLRTATTPPPLVARLQDPAEASAWYPCSPTWFGNGGGRPGTRNHTEVLATYDNTALYIAFMNIDRSTRVYPQGTTTDLTLVDSNAIWIQTPDGRRFYFLATVDDRYPAQPKRASGEFPSFDGKTNKLAGWENKGWFAGNLSIQQTIRIPWSTMGVSAPAPGSRWRVNFLNYNQTSTIVGASTVNIQKWTPGNETQPDQWGYLAFDEAPPPPPSATSPEAVLTLRPATGSGAEVTLSPGNYADSTNRWANEAVTQSNWNDWDPVDYTIKEFLQYDLSLVPKDRQIISATLSNYCRGNYNSGALDLYVHVMRLAGTYDPSTVTMATSPLPVENGFRRLVGAGEGKIWVDFDVTDIMRTAFEAAASKASFALAGSSGDTRNGKIWGISYGRADYYDGQRPKLILTFGKPGVAYNAPLVLGSGNYVSVATASNKNKLTNGTFRYGIVEGVSNTTYWRNPGWAYVNGKNVPYLVKAGDVNSVTGNRAIRFMTPAAWKYIKQTTTAVVAGKTYTLSGYIKGSASGVKGDIRLTFRDAAGASLGSGMFTYQGSGNWEQIKVKKTAPSGTSSADVYIYDDTSGDGQYLLLSDFQLEEGSTPTAYSETMGVYYPDYPRTDGVSTSVPNISLSLTVDKAEAKPGETLTYTITYRNTGAGPASSVAITCPLPQFTTYLSGGAYDSAAKSVKWTIPSVPSGGNGSLAFSVKVD